jgi:hypothetical protein
MAELWGKMKMVNPLTLIILISMCIGPKHYHHSMWKVVPGAPFLSSSPWHCFTHPLLSPLLCLQSTPFLSLLDSSFKISHSLFYAPLAAWDLNSNSSFEKNKNNQILAWPICWMKSGKSLNFSEPQFLYLLNGTVITEVRVVLREVTTTLPSLPLL